MSAERKTVEHVQNAVAERLRPEVVSNLPAVAPQGSGRTMFAPTTLGEAMELAKMLSIAHGAVPPHLRGRPGDCLAIVMQSGRWGMDPFAVALKSYFVNDRIAYEAQLVNAVCNTLAPLDGRLHVEWSGEGEGLWCRVSGKLKGDPRDKVVEQDLRTIKTRNSPLWNQSPKQQLAYYTTRLWVRLYCPEVLLGVYTPDELQEQPHIGPERAKDITPPRPTRADFVEQEQITEADERAADRMTERAIRGEDPAGEEETEEAATAAQPQPSPWRVSAEAFPSAEDFAGELRRLLTDECKSKRDVGDCMTANVTRYGDLDKATQTQIDKLAKARKGALPG